MVILTFQQKHDFWKRPFNLSTQNLLCIEYGHLDLSMIWGKPFYFVHPKFIQPQFLFLMEKSILYAKITVSKKNCFKTEF